MKILEEVLNKNNNKPYSFGWINATCHDSLSNNFNINNESLPNLVVYVPSKDVYVSLLGSYDVENINYFIERIMQGKVHFNRIDREKIKLPPLKCEEIKEYNENLEEDEVLKELLEEEKLKRESLEKERKRQELNIKKKKKKNSDL